MLALLVLPRNLGDLQGCLIATYLGLVISAPLTLLGRTTSTLHRGSGLRGEEGEEGAAYSAAGSA